MPGEKEGETQRRSIGLCCIAEFPRFLLPAPLRDAPLGAIVPAWSIAGIAASASASPQLLRHWPCVLCSDTWSQSGGGIAVDPDAEFRFVGSPIPALGARSGSRGGWLTDWPDAEQHLIKGVQRLTRIDAAEEGQSLSIMDESLFDYPWLYAVEVGSWMLSDEEAARLRDYLLRGGFLVVDDFHGSMEWAGFIESMHRVFPDRAIVEIPIEDRGVSCRLRSARNRCRSRASSRVYSGLTYERDGYTPHWRGIYDDEGRLMVVINFNMDLGDAWEHADVPEYALQYTTRAYKYAINYILYAMTH